MSHRLNQSYKAFTSKDWPSAPSPASGSPASAASAQRPAGAASGSRNVLGFVTGLADPGHSILIRALLDRESLPVSDHASGFAGLSAGPSAYAMVQDRVERIREESALKFLEFRDKWRKRLAFVQLHPFLQRNQWFRQDLAGFSLVGKGTRKEAKMLYLQSLHDMASDGERQVSALSGHMFRLQGELAAIWHRESVRDDRSKLLPALEAALRNGEAELFKRVRLSLGDLALDTFTERVAKWDKRVYGSEEEMFRGIAWPWQSARYRSGFEGFMETFADLAESVCAAMLAHYEGKWDLFLRGLTPPQQSPFSRPALPARMSDSPAP
ncbi:MAG TPA: hypothetical protein VJ385_07025 [Fibrobacteria bacterium]|nr:hypothetical protein [Fibrobacteria bacterium]